MQRKANIEREIFALALSLALLSGCGAAPAGQTAESGDPAEGGSAAENFGALGAASVVSSAVEQLDFVLDSEEHSDRRAAEDGTELATYTYAIPVLHVETANGQTLDSAATAVQRQALDVAAAFNDTFAKWVESTDFPGFFTWAQEDYTMRQRDGQEWSAPYDETFTYTFWRTDALISVAGEYYSYAGGAHPNTVLLGWNFDLRTGRFIHPAVLGADTEEFQAAVTTEIISQANQRAMESGYAPTEMFWEDYQDIAAQWPEYAVSFTDEGMTVVFSPYELAAYAAGPQKFQLGMDFLKPYLSEEGMDLLGLSEN